MELRHVRSEERGSRIDGDVTVVRDEAGRELAALAELRQIADTRTPEQDAIAKFWALPGGYAVAQSYNNRIATDLITQTISTSAAPRTRSRW